MLPGEPFQVGGGWHREFTTSQDAAPRGHKRPSDAQDAWRKSNKRPHLASQDDRTTEPESEDEPLCPSTQPTVRSSATPIDQRPNPNPSSTLGTHPPPPALQAGLSSPSRELSATTLSANQTSPGQSRSIPDSPHLTQPLPPLPNLLSPLRGPVHARLRGKVLERYINSAECKADAADAAKAAARAQALDKESDEIFPTDEVVLETTHAPRKQSQPESNLHTPRVAHIGSVVPQRTYSGSRSHIPSPSPSQLQLQPNTATTAEADDDTSPLLRPDSPEMSATQLMRREWAEAVRARLQADLQTERPLPRPRPRPRPHPHPRPLFAQASQPPSSQPQVRSPPVASTSAPAAHTRKAPHLDPVAAARQEITRLKEARAKKRSTSSALAGTSQTERTAPDPFHEQTSDDNELPTQGEAHNRKTRPVSSIL